MFKAIRIFYWNHCYLFWIQLQDVGVIFRHVSMLLNQSNWDVFICNSQCLFLQRVFPHLWQPWFVYNMKSKHINFQYIMEVYNFGILLWIVTIQIAHIWRWGLKNIFKGEYGVIIWLKFLQKYTTILQWIGLPLW